MNRTSSPPRHGDSPHTNSLMCLWPRVLAGEPAAGDAVVRRYRGCVLRRVSRILDATDPAVDDVVQMTFITALDDPARFQGQSTLRTWLLGIASNKARMTLRSRARRRKAIEQWGTLQALTEPRNPACAETRQAGSRIQAALATLESNRRTVFVLTEVKGFTAAEAATAVGAPPGTVRRWRVEARSHLRLLLVDLRPSGPDTRVETNSKGSDWIRRAAR